MRLIDATFEDRERLALLMHDFYSAEPGVVSLSPEEARAKAERLFAVVPEHARPLFIVEAGRTLGYLLVVPVYSNEYGGFLAFLDELCISAQERGNGRGSDAIRLLKDWGLERGFRGIFLETTEANARVRDFYHRHGFSMPSRRIMTWFPADEGPLQ